MEIARLETTNAWLFTGVDKVFGVQVLVSLCDSVNQFDLFASWDYLLYHNGCMRCVSFTIIYGILFQMCVDAWVDWHCLRSKVSIRFVTIDHLMWLHIIYYIRYSFRMFSHNSAVFLSPPPPSSLCSRTVCSNSHRFRCVRTWCFGWHEWTTQR